MTRRPGLVDLAMMGILVLAVVVLFWRAVLLQGTFFVQDMMFQNYPFRDFFSQALKGGHLPLWDPAINCGFPLFAEGQAGILYPPNLISAFLLATHVALNYSIVIHLMLAGVGAYGLLRSFGAVPGAALLAGLCYGCGGYLVVRATSPNYLAVCAWLPVLLTFLELAAARREWIWLPLAGGVLGLQLLAGHPQAAVYGLVAAVAFGLYRGLVVKAGWRFLVATAVGVPALGLGLAAAQVLPTAELVGLTPRGSGLRWEEFASMSLPPERLLSLFLPNAFGNDAYGTYWGGEAGFFIQLCAYGGVIPLLLALVAVRERRDPATRFFGALCVIALVLALGRYTGAFEVLYRVPGMSMFRIPARFLLWYAVGLAVLAGLGADRLLRGDAGPRPSGWWLVILPALAGGTMAWTNRELLLSGAAMLTARSGSALARYVGDLRFDLVRLLLLSLVAVVAANRRPAGRAHVGVAAGLALLVFADLWTFEAGFNGVLESRVFVDPPASARAILADAGPDRTVPPRVLSLVSERNAPYDWHRGWALDQRSYRHYPELLRMYTPGLYGLAGVLPGWSPLHLERHWEFMRGYPALASLAGIEYLVSHEPLHGPGLAEIHRGQVRVYRNESALPRAQVVGAYRVIPDPEERLRYLRGSDFDPRREVVLEAPPGTVAEGGEGRARVIRYLDDEVSVQVEAPAGGLLVLADTEYPGWRAWVDGQAAPILRANHVFRAVPLPAGAREVIFRYAPRSFTVGAWISAVSLLLFLICLGSVRGRTVAGSSGPSVVADWPLAGWAVQAALVFLVHALATRWPLWAEALERSRALAAWGG